MPRPLLTVAAVALTLAAAMVSPAAAAHRAPVEHAGLDQGAPAYYDSGIARTPYMGWNTYFAVGAASEEKVTGVADFLVSSGLAKAGYDIVWIDGGWNASPPRDGADKLVPDPARFPSGFTTLVDRLHAKGLRAGIYTDAGAWDGVNCAAGSGGGYYEADAKQFADWEFDAIKIDFRCGIAQDMDPAVAFTEFSDAVREAGRTMILTFVSVRTQDDAVWFRQRTADGWSAWTSLGGVVSGSPTLVASADRVYLFARGSDYTLWQQNFVDDAWGGWFKRDQYASNSIVGAVGAAEGANGSAWLAVRGPDHAVHQVVL